MSTERLDSIRFLVREKGDDALLLTAREDIRWACGFTGSHGALLLNGSTAVLFTDSRYTDQALSETQGVGVEIVTGDLIEAAGQHPAASGLDSVGLDGNTVTVSELRRVQSWPDEPKARAYDGPLSVLLSRKSDDEITRLRSAQEITDSVFEEILPLIKPGVTERELAAEIVYRHLKKGAESMSFEPIVASGPNGALPHARAGDRAFEDGDLIVLDFGCFFHGYASDMTRTVALGTPEPESLRIYEIVRTAQRTAEVAARSGMRACDLDRAGRQVIEGAGLGSAFTHSLGHGIGLRIHEPPRIASTNEEILPDGAVVTIEPGVYLPGRFGIRIENSVVLRSTGCEPLPRTSTELLVL